MSQVGTLEAGSRHDLRVGISPDAPDEEDLARRRGRVRLRAFLRDVVPLRRAGPAGRAVRVGLPAALHVLPQPRYLAPEGRHVRLGPAGARSAEGFAPALRSLDGGLTISGGEPMVQIGVHPADLGGRQGDGPAHRDRNVGLSRRPRRRRYLSALDLVLLDIKSSDPETYSKVTGRDLAPTLRFAERLAEIGKPAWVRFTLVPGHTDDPANVEGIARFVAPMKNVEWVEVQPFHQLGAFKWKAMGLEYKHRRHADAATGTDQARDRAVPRGGLQCAVNAVMITIRDRGDTSMLDLARDIIGTQPILAVFLAIGVGYLVGQINLGGFSLGVGAVLFVGLAIGAFAPKAQIVGPIGLTGLIMFLYGIGILYGRQFFEGMAGAAGHKGQSAGAGGVIAGLRRRARAGPGLRHQDRPHARHVRRLDDQHRDAAGGARRHEEQRSVDRLFDRVSVRRDRPDPVHLFHDAAGEAEVSRRRRSGSTWARSRSAQAVAGRTLDDVLAGPAGGRAGDDGPQGRSERRPDGLIRSRRRRWAADHRREQEDARQRRGQARPARARPDRQGSLGARLHPRVRRQGERGGRSAGATAAAGGFPIASAACPPLRHGSRADARPDAGVRRPRRRADAARAKGRDPRALSATRVKATAEFSYVSLGLGMVLGVLLGLIPIPIPGVGTVTLGIGGGPLIVALILGKLRRTGPMLWTMPLPANIVLRNFGLAMFLAAVGINAGQPFVRTVAESGLTMLFIGAAVLLTTVLIVLLVGYYLMKIPYDDLVGVASGATGNPAILVYSTRMAPTERPDIGYAMIFPSMTIVKVIAVQIVGLMFLASG